MAKYTEARRLIQKHGVKVASLCIAGSEIRGDALIIEPRRWYVNAKGFDAPDPYSAIIKWRVRVRNRKPFTRFIRVSVCRKAVSAHSIVQVDQISIVTKIDPDIPPCTDGNTEHAWKRANDRIRRGAYIEKYVCRKCGLVKILETKMRRLFPVPITTTRYVSDESRHRQTPSVHDG